MRDHEPDTSVTRYVNERKGQGPFNESGTAEYFVSCERRSIFLSYRKHRLLYDKKLRRDRTAADGKISLMRPAAGGESCRQDSFFHSNPYRRLNGKVNKENIWDSFVM